MSYTPNKIVRIGTKNIIFIKVTIKIMHVSVVVVSHDYHKRTTLLVRSLFYTNLNNYNNNNGYR
jgi:hypothetical protein